MDSVTHPAPSAAPNSSCQVVDTVHDAKVSIAVELERIRERQGIPPVVDVDRSTPAARRRLAVEHVQRRRQRPEERAVDPLLWVEIVEQHLTPSGDRPWRRRQWQPQSARRRADQLERDQDHTPSDPMAPVLDLLEARAAEQRAASAYAAWAMLNGVGLAGDGDEDDLVSNTLATDLAATAG